MLRVVGSCWGLLTVAGGCAKAEVTVSLAVLLARLIQPLVSYYMKVSAPTLKK